MKRYFIIAAAAISLAACSNKKDQRPQTAMDTGTAFIRASLDGDFKTAEPLLLNDSSNHQLFDTYKDSYGKIPAEKKKSYKESSYNINKVDEVIPDSVTIINYSNSFMNKPTEIKLVRVDKTWWVDFKYTISGQSSN